MHRLVGPEEKEERTRAFAERWLLSRCYRNPHFSLTGRQALALLRILERNRTTLEQQAKAERDREFGRGPGAHSADVPQKIRKGDPRIGKRAITHDDRPTIDGKVTAILRYSNGAEQLEVTQLTYALGSKKPGTTVGWVHVDDVDLL